MSEYYNLSYKPQLDRLEIKTTWPQGEPREAELERRVAFLENEIIDLISEVHRLRNRLEAVTSQAGI